jgi:hypothetical protein
MNQASQPRTAAKIIGDLLDAANAAAEIVARGKDSWDHDRLLRLAGEAVISRIGDAAAKLPNDIKRPARQARTPARHSVAIQVTVTPPRVAQLNRRFRIERIGSPA